jgi:uncharacterized protein (DUF433 family)
VVDRIVRNSAILFGKPVVKGTRISVAVVLEYLSDNPNLDDLLADYPRLTIDDVQACFAFAQTLVEATSRAKMAALGAAMTDALPFRRELFLGLGRDV